MATGISAAKRSTGQKKRDQRVRQRDRLQAEVRNLSHKITQLQEALEKYGNHQVECNLLYETGAGEIIGGCQCGLTAAKEKEEHGETSS